VAQFVSVCRVADVPEGRALAVEVDGLRIAVFNDGGRFHALFGRCPHANGALGRGWIEGGEAVCPLHHWRFRLDTGRCTTVRGESVHRFRCEVRGDEVWVEAG
jgi:nitrite reductase (NADH) small subunit